MNTPKSTNGSIVSDEQLEIVMSRWQDALNAWDNSRKSSMNRRQKDIYLHCAFAASMGAITALVGKVESYQELGKDFKLQLRNEINKHLLDIALQFETINTPYAKKFADFIRRRPYPIK